jgi:hypothetical protein
MLFVHANWTGGALRLWAESLGAYLATPEGRKDRANDDALAQHAFAAPSAEIESELHRRFEGASIAQNAQFMTLRLPGDVGGVLPSDRLAAAAGAAEPNGDPELHPFHVPAVVLDPAQTLATLLAMENAGADGAFQYAAALRYWQEVGRFVLDLLAEQRFIPTLVHASGEGLEARWQPWLHDEPARARVAALLAAMPPVVRAVVDNNEGHPWSILNEALQTLTDATVRSILTADSFGEAIEDRDGTDDANVTWLSGLLGENTHLGLTRDRSSELLHVAGRWVGRLDDTGRGRQLRLGFRLHEPESGDALPDLEPVPDDVFWRLSLHLHAADDPAVIVDAEEVWGLASGSSTRSGHLAARADELLLKELGRASQVYPMIESILEEATPVGIDLTTDQACAFLSEYRPLLEESGFVVEVPDWWDAPTRRLGARLQIDAGEPPASGTQAAPGLGLDSLVGFKWQIAVGDQPLTEQEFQQLVAHPTPLVRIRGQWVQVEPSQVESALKFLAEESAGEMSLLQALQTAHGLGPKPPGMPVFGLDATGWVDDLIRGTAEPQRMPIVDPPKLFRGELREYQKRGLSWLAFLDGFGLGACLADDMGLGKTIQLIALLQHERAEAPEDVVVGPTLLLVPTSLIGNWCREIDRFGPELRVHVHHGPDRPVGEQFVKTVGESDVVISTYGLVSRDRDVLAQIRWHRVALDEAQYIKNPPTKQTRSIRSLAVNRRVALTGTPVENRLSELWSIMEFCNPGYLGAAGDFRRRFAVPIERHRDTQQAEALRRLVLPFVLRRLKTEPGVVDDLPPCVTTREDAILTPMQAARYEQIVSEMLGRVDAAEGMQRRGLVLSALVKLKQVCNHPSLIDETEREAMMAGDADIPTIVSQSGKLTRLLTMLEEIIATGDKALVFTQFRRMGHLLTAVAQHVLDTEVLFLHGGTPAHKRQGLIDRFQDPQIKAPIFVLSLKAGGVGLNLTAATHVFHYDRWWNPAVEDQATDRAFRIGQTRTVHVHKFVCAGTLEERIDEMIRAKTELAKRIIGSGEQWLTELSTGQLRDLLNLRESAVEGEA